MNEQNRSLENRDENWTPGQERECLIDNLKAMLVTDADYDSTLNAIERLSKIENDRERLAAEKAEREARIKLEKRKAWVDFGVGLLRVAVPAVIGYRILKIEDSDNIPPHKGTFGFISRFIK